MTCNVVVGKKDVVCCNMDHYWGYDWISAIQWKIITGGCSIELVSYIHNNGSINEGYYTQYESMIKAIENDNESLIHLGTSDCNGDTRESLKRLVGGDFILIIDDCEIKINLGKTLNNKAIFERIISQLR